MRRISRVLSAVAGLAVGLVGAEMTFGALRPREPRSDAVLYSIEVRNDAGDLLASPMLVGEENRPVHLSLAGPHSEPKSPTAKPATANNSREIADLRRSMATLPWNVERLRWWPARQARGVQ